MAVSSSKTPISIRLKGPKQSPFSFVSNLSGSINRNKCCCFFSQSLCDICFLITHKQLRLRQSQAQLSAVTAQLVHKLEAYIQSLATSWLFIPRRKQKKVTRRLLSTNTSPKHPPESHRKHFGGVQACVKFDICIQAHDRSKELYGQKQQTRH